MKPICKSGLELGALGLRVFPIIEDHKEPVSRGWRDEASANPQDIYRMFARGRPNLGVATGPGSGVIVLGVEIGDHGRGQNTLSELENRHGKLPPTWTSMTFLSEVGLRPNGIDIGFHWFLYPTVRHVGTQIEFAPGLSIQGEGGFVVAPPSTVDERRTSNGCAVVRWINEPSSLPLAPAPEWLFDLVAPQPHQAT